MPDGKDAMSTAPAVLAAPAVVLAAAVPAAVVLSNVAAAVVVVVLARTAAAVVVVVVEPVAGAATGAGVTVAGAIDELEVTDDADGAPEAATVDGVPRVSSALVSVFAATTGFDPAIGGSAPGGYTLKTCPTSIRFGFSRPFQRTMSRQFWPLSRPMRTSVSPGLTT